MCGCSNNQHFATPDRLKTRLRVDESQTYTRLCAMVNAYNARLVYAVRINKVRALLTYTLLSLMVVYAVVSFFFEDIVDFIPYQAALGGSVPELLMEIAGLRGYISSKFEVLDDYDDIILELIREYNMLPRIPSEQLAGYNLSLFRKVKWWNDQFTKEYAGEKRDQMPKIIADVAAAQQAAEEAALAGVATNIHAGHIAPASLALDSDDESDDDDEIGTELPAAQPRMRRAPSMQQLQPRVRRNSGALRRTEDGIEL